MVNNHYPQQTDHQQRPIAMANIFTLSEQHIVIMSIDNNYASYQDAQDNVFSMVNYFGVILKVTGHDIGSVRHGP